MLSLSFLNILYPTRTPENNEIDFIMELDLIDQILVSILCATAPMYASSSE
jgi:hypothetical protein